MGLGLGLIDELRPALEQSKLLLLLTLTLPLTIPSPALEQSKLLLLQRGAGAERRVQVVTLAVLYARQHGGQAVVA